MIDFISDCHNCLSSLWQLHWLKMQVLWHSKNMYICIHMYIRDISFSPDNFYTGNLQKFPQIWICQPQNIILWSWPLIFKTEKRSLSSYFYAYTAGADFKNTSTSSTSIRSSSTVHLQLFQNAPGFWEKPVQLTLPSWDSVKCLGLSRQDGSVHFSLSYLNYLL